MDFLQIYLSFNLQSTILHTSVNSGISYQSPACLSWSVCVCFKNVGFAAQMRVLVDILYVAEQ